MRRDRLVGGRAVVPLTGDRLQWRRGAAADRQKLQNDRHLLVDLIDASVELAHLAPDLRLHVVNETLQARLLLLMLPVSCRWRCVRATCTCTCYTPFTLHRVLYSSYASLITDRVSGKVKQSKLIRRFVQRIAVTTSNALRHGSHRFTCKLHHACLYSPAAEHHRPLAGTHFTVPRKVEG